MKLLITSLISTLSLAAMACPSFNGTYACKGEGIEQVIHVKTTTANGMTQYSLDETHLVADGAYHKVSYMGGEYDMSATCTENNSLKINIILDGGEGDNAECGAEKWNLLYTLNWTPNGNNISETHTGATMCASGKVVPTGDKGSMNCVKQ